MSGSNDRAYSRAIVRRVFVAQCRWYVCLFLSVLTISSQTASAEWTVKRLYDRAGNPKGCELESEVAAISDGYNSTQVVLVVRKNAVVIKARAPLDASFSDLGLQVENAEFIRPDKLSGDREAVFEKQYGKMMAQFNGTPVGDKAKKPSLPKPSFVKVYLRFWPTWPATDRHSTAFALEGFSQTYAGLLACK